MNLEQNSWEIVTNYYKAMVKFESLELPLMAPHLLSNKPGSSGADEENGSTEWNALFEKNI